jgi:outer membrane protein OmpA-like peptidoglycan-associated protein
LFFRLLRFFQRYWLCLFFLVSQPLFALDPQSEQDAYGLGMGSAVAAIAGGTHAIEWNPAGVARATVPMAQMGLGFDPHSMDFQLNTSVLYPVQDGTVFALSQFSDFPKSPNSRTTYIGTVALPLNPSKDFFAGLNLKYLTLSTGNGSAIESGQGFGLDFGLTYDLRRPQGTIASFALAIKDLDTEVRFNDTLDQPVTRTFILGAAYENIQDTRIEMDYDIIDQTLQDSDLHNRLRLGAERFFDDRFYSVRLGYDDLFNSDGYFSMGAGYHPNQPYEITYSFRVSTSNSQFSNFLSFVYRFDSGGKNESAIEVPVSSSSSVINLGAYADLIEPPATTGKPVSAIPLQKMSILVDPAVFSPSGKEKTTSISFPEDHSANVARWIVTIQSSDQKIIRRLGGTGPIAPSFIWDGLDEEGKPAREGNYRIGLKTFGMKNDLLSDDFTSVTILSPRSHFEIETTETYFSNHSSKNKKNEVVFNINAGGSPEVQSWDFKISGTLTNKVVFEKTGKSRLPKSIKWNGQNLNGESVPDGSYSCFLTAQDEAGNPLKTDAVPIFVNNKPPELSFKGEDNLVDFSSSKEFHFDIHAADPIGIESWKLTILDENHRPLKIMEGAGQPSEELTWDGKTSNDQEIEPGTFVESVFSATDKAGNITMSNPVPLQVDYHAPSNQEQLTLNLTTVYFDALSSNLTESDKKEIEKSADSIKPYIHKSILIVKGYGSPEESGDLLSLSHARALEVKKYLIRILKIPANNIYAVGYSDREPLKSSQNVVTEDSKRRAILTLTTLP